jgi:hypothetical protein
MEIGHRDRRGNGESANRPYECAPAIFDRKPVQPGQGTNRRPDPDNASDYGSGEEAGLARGVAKDGTDDGAEARKGPGTALVGAQ